MNSRARLGRRSSGVLLHPTSLPGPFPCGDLGPAAHEFVEFLVAAGQTWWQMLPIVPVGIGGSPYQGTSASAGNPLLISLDRLADDGLLTRREINAARRRPSNRADSGAAERVKLPLLRRAFEGFERGAGRVERARFAAFCRRHAAWLDDYAAFCALKAARGGRSWVKWEPAIRDRRPAALAEALRDVADDVRFHRFLQFVFFRQWGELRAACHRRGVGLIGDIPIFVAHDSADVWAHPELFKLRRDGRPIVVSGVPPDCFSRTGQLWGNPLYRWDVLRRRGYDWWIERFRATLELFDVVRIDHFIGFVNYWAVPGGARTAARGRWMPGPGAHFFQVLRRRLGILPIIAEDLGAVTPAVVALREQFDLPGMRILQFAFGGDPATNVHALHRHTRRCVVYPGTHDNNTVVGWLRGRARTAGHRRERRRALEFLGTDGREFHWDMIRLTLSSVADTAIVAAQDLLGLGEEARMNLPGTASGNWRWRLLPGQLDRRVARRLRRLTELCGRLNAGESTVTGSDRSRAERSRPR